MNRQELLKWIEIAGNIASKNSEIYYCPNDNSPLKYEITPYPKFRKLELNLICRECSRNYTATIDLDDNEGNVIKKDIE